jgi:hypothetical protein
MIKGKGWELYIKRFYQQKREDKIRTVGHYQVFHNGIPTDLAGMTAESSGPGNNKVVGNGKCIELGTYPVATQNGTRYKTFGYKMGDAALHPQPGFELLNTGNRKEIIVHPGSGFLKSIGCINLTSTLITGDSDMDFAASRWRVLSAIEDMKKFLAGNFPDKNGYPIPDSTVVIEE